MPKSPPADGILSFWVHESENARLIKSCDRRDTRTRLRGYSSREVTRQLRHAHLQVGLPFTGRDAALRFWAGSRT